MDSSSILNLYGNISVTSDVRVDHNGAGIPTIKILSPATINVSGSSNHLRVNYEINQTNGTDVVSLAGVFENYAANFTITKGTFSTANYTFTPGNFIAKHATNDITVNLGSSNIYTNGCNTTLFWEIGTTSNITMNAGTSTIVNDVGSTRTFQGGGKTYYNLVALAYNSGNSSTTIKNSNTFNNLTASVVDPGTSISTCSLIFEKNTTQTILGNVKLSFTGVETVNLSSDTSGTAATLSKSSGIVQTDYKVIKDITATGGATWYAGTHSTNVSGNTGWTFSDYSGPLYWVGGTGNWTDSENHWAGSSGGAPYSVNVPSSTTDVFINSSSGFGSGGTITLDAPVSYPTCNNFLSNSGHSFTLGNGYLLPFGSLTLEEGITGSDFNVSTKATSGSYTITTAGVIFASLSIGTGGSGSTSSWTTQDNTVVTGRFYQENGTFDVNDFNITANDFYFYADTGFTPTVVMGSGTWEATTNDGWVIDEYSGQVVTITAETSTLKMSDTSAFEKLFYGGSKIYNNFWITGVGTGWFTLYGSNTFNDFKIDTPPHSVRFYEGTTQTVTTFTVSGTVGNLITLDKMASGVGQFTLSKSSGTVSCDYLDISHSNTTGGATWYAGSHSADTTNNDGWLFEDAPSTVKRTLGLLGVGG
jgi:dihydrofolate reductase